MLVRRRVENNLRTVGAEGVVYPFRESHVPDDGREGQVGILVPELKAKVMQRRLRVVERHHVADAQPCQLAAQLRAYRTRGTRHQYRPVLEPGNDLVHGNPDFRTTQQVLDTDLAHGHRNFPVPYAVYDR